MPPEPANYAGRWILPIDYPTRELKKDLSAYVDFELAVDKEGEILGCSATKVQGKKPFGEYTCSLVRNRAKLHPARDSSGNAHFGIYRSTISWTTGEAIYKPRPVYHVLALKLPTLPDSAAEPSTVDLALAVDAKGKAFACDRMEDDDNAELLSIACDQAMKAEWTIVTTPDGKAHPSIQNATILFITDEKSKD